MALLPPHAAWCPLAISTTDTYRPLDPAEVSLACAVGPCRCKTPDKCDPDCPYCTARRKQVSA